MVHSFVLILVDLSYSFLLTFCRCLQEESYFMGAGWFSDKVGTGVLRYPCGISDTEHYICRKDFNNLEITPLKYYSINPKTNREAEGER